MRKLVLYLILLVVVCSENILAQNNSTDTKFITPSFVSIKGQRIFDKAGREITFNGVNLVNKNPKDNYLYLSDSISISNFKNIGVNIIRLGIIWDGLEPEPGKINESYLKQIDRRIQWAKDNGVYVMLDMHQDLYSVLYSDGAPIWATLTDEEEHVTGQVWSDAYELSGAVKRSFSNFWKNKPASDGVGIQDHYINVWQKIADRYKDNPIVIGFDIMNEPFMGEEAPMIMEKLLTEAAICYVNNGEVPNLFTRYWIMAKLGLGIGDYSVESITKMWENQATRGDLLNKLSKKDVYNYIVSQVHDDLAEFELNTLSPFYQKVRDSIRSVNRSQILFLNHNYFCNLGPKSAFEVPKQSNGLPDNLVVYTPHAYDLTVDTELAGDTNSKNRLNHIFENIFEAGKEKNIPIIVDEWGATYKEEVLKYQISIMESYHMGQTYWAFSPGDEVKGYFKNVINRAYPMRVAGQVISFSSMNKSQIDFKWRNNPHIKKPTVLYIPDFTSIDKEKITTSSSELELVWSNMDNSRGGYIIIPALKEEKNLELIIPYK